MEKEVIKSKEFIDRFVECLEKGEDFTLEDCIVEGDVDILDIYDRIKDDEELKRLIDKQKDTDVITITTNAGINLSFYNVEFNGNFQMFKFKIEIVETIKKISIKILLGSVNFIESTFKGKVDFRCSEIQGEVTIIDSTFMEDIIFRESTFKEDVYFEKSDKFENNLVIKGEINFTDSIFEKNVYFMDSIVFKKKVDFNNSTFKGNVYFENLVFEKILDFSSSTFEGNVNFNGLIIFERGADFRNSTFEKNVSFWYPKFKWDVIFEGSEFKEKAYFHGLTVEGKANFNNSIFSGKTYFSHSTFEKWISFRGSEFKGDVNFSDSKFKEKAEFTYLTFEKDVNFSNVIFNKAKFFNATFKSRADFRGICFVLLSFVDCTFEDLLFRKGKIKFEKSKKVEINLEKPNDQWIHTIINIIKGECLAIFLNVQFLNKHAKIENFPLSKTSFLKTDVREVMLLCNIKKEKILSHKLLKNDKNNEGIYKETYNILKNHLDYKSVLAEYRNLRISIENNRTYIEASDLYKMEMELIKEYSNNEFEKYIIKAYGAISDYGESISIPIFWFVILIFTTPFVLILFHCLNSLINIQIPNTILDFLLLYAEYLKSVLGSKFYIGDGKTLMDTIIYCIYSILSIIILGNLYIALRRKLSRK
ncbi:pentapeptide repeat-containing protein [Methanotorris formicicus]|uniref:Pentapeptide repeat protein n=1 Tax=Methanotorris formicicus Mc-S-70 TaxID=647171 RepID=H1KYN8_9EURY|nr:pentapeptide repeat-containing protein [Methanotorris formicicus]EHP86942.1 hypothetical protein MetfoDRAFT_0911 [Methanotorris formicicus Mc-S-70]